MNTSLSQKRGFTLIEIIVSMAIFAVVAVVAVGALLKIIDSNKKAQNIQAAVTNLNFAMTTMSRELIVGSKYNCNSNFMPADSGNTLSTYFTNVISFRSSGSVSDPTSPTKLCKPNTAYAYRFNPISGVGYSLQKAEQSRIVSCGNSISDSDFHDIISSVNVIITGYKINLIYDQTTHQYPIVTIRVIGYAGASEKDKTYFDIQTSASARKL